MYGQSHGVYGRPGEDTLLSCPDHGSEYPALWLVNTTYPHQQLRPELQELFDCTRKNMFNNHVSYEISKIDRTTIEHYYMMDKYLKCKSLYFILLCKIRARSASECWVRMSHQTEALHSALPETADLRPLISTAGLSVVHTWVSHPVCHQIISVRSVKYYLVSDKIKFTCQKNCSIWDFNLI